MVVSTAFKKIALLLLFRMVNDFPEIAVPRWAWAWVWAYGNSERNKGRR
jgi:hypothetical protein